MAEIVILLKDKSVLLALALIKNLAAARILITLAKANHLELVMKTPHLIAAAVRIVMVEQIAT